MNTPHSPSDADVRFAFAWLALYFMLIAGGLAGERDVALRHHDGYPIPSALSCNSDRPAAQKHTALL